MNRLKKHELCGPMTEDPADIHDEPVREFNPGTLKVDNVAITRSGKLGLVDTGGPKGSVFISLDGVAVVEIQRAVVLSV